jgi:predicted enzyme related to lactoylglutathione lyase
MPIHGKYAHTNLVARDWRRLAHFYETVFGCVPILPERHFDEEWLSQGSGVVGATLSGIHLRPPGCGEAGPTLEIFQYGRTEQAAIPSANRMGFGHIAFVVDDVSAARDAVLAGGGSLLGEIVSVDLADAGTVTWVYVRDPEGNIIELQHRG